MQKIVHSKSYIHSIFNELEQFYCLTSTKTVDKNKLLPLCFDKSFKYLHGLFYQYGIDEYKNYNIKFKDKSYKSIKLPKFDEKNMIVIFSGGKDSTAAILHYQKQGYKIHLFHALGINKSYPDEWKRAQEIADYLNLPIHYEKFEFEGKQEFPDHPMKNMIIAARALQWGIENNIGTKITCGNYYTLGLEKSSFYINGDDSILMWDAYTDIIKRIIPNYRMYIGLKNEGSTYKLLLQDPKLIELCQSCVGAQRFRDWNKKNNEKKYKIGLMPNRCGSCWKCAVEYIYLADHNLYVYNEAYYKHCLDVVKKDAKQVHSLEDCSIINVWNGHFYYDIKKSKYKNILNYK